MNYTKSQLQTMAKQQGISEVYFRDIIGNTLKGEYWVHTHNSSENFKKLIEKINQQYGITDIKVTLVKRLNAVNQYNIQINIAGVNLAGNNRSQILAFFQELIQRNYGPALSVDFPTYVIKVTVQPIQLPQPQIQTITLAPEDVEDYMSYLNKKNMLKSSLTFKEMVQLELI